MVYPILAKGYRDTPEVPLREAVPLIQIPGFWLRLGRSATDRPKNPGIRLGQWLSG